VIVSRHYSSLRPGTGEKSGFDSQTVCSFLNWLPISWNPEDLPMRTFLILFLATLSVGCSSRNALDRHIDSAYRYYEQGDCGKVVLELSQAERRSRPRDNLQPEI